MVYSKVLFIHFIFKKNFFLPYKTYKEAKLLCVNPNQSKTLVFTFFFQGWNYIFFSFFFSFFNLDKFSSKKYVKTERKYLLTDKQMFY